MPRSFKCILGPVLTLATLVAAQTPGSTQIATPPAQIQPNDQTPAKSTTTIRAQAKLVVVDVTVSDKNGNPLHDLKREDFTVLENSGPQTINAFEEPPKNVIASATSTTPATATTAGTVPLASDNGRLIRAAMMHGAPGATEILYKVRVLPTKDVEDLIAEGNVLSPLGLKKASGRFRRYIVDFDADAKDMLFPPKPDGGFDCKVEFVVQVYQADGQLVNTPSRTLIATLSIAQRNKLVYGGFPFHEEVSVPVNGTYSLRIGVHDFTSDHIGAVEVATSEVKNLQPPAAPPPPTTPSTSPAAEPASTPTVPQ
jgi:hypothetical protein